MSYDAIAPGPPVLALEKHSGPGIASFVIAVAQGAMTVIAVAVSAIMVATGPRADHEFRFMILGFVIIGGILAHILGLALGIVGVVQKNRKRLFSIMGLVFNAVAVLSAAALLLIGLLAGRSHGSAEDKARPGTSILEPESVP